MRTLALSDAKARLSQVIREVRATGETTVVTVDGEPAVTIQPFAGNFRKLTPVEVKRYQLIEAGLRAMDWSGAPFDAVTLVQEGRR
ncbi:MAG: hypothetical protein A2138_23590 [Deltaproteobacteria bacterium RBG_16_71_12]|nr:MAG: hypothetical protein A2138_23590 [Deltaproteobacteria bacterium RBG_16_71_12]